MLKFYFRSCTLLYVTNINQVMIKCKKINRLKDRNVDGIVNTLLGTNFTYSSVDKLLIIYVLLFLMEMTCILNKRGPLDAIWWHLCICTPYLGNAPANWSKCYCRISQNTVKFIDPMFLFFMYHVFDGCW